MSDTSSRPVGGPPKRAAKAPASSLIKRNRPQPSFPSATENEAQAVVETPAPERVQAETSADAITPDAFLERPSVATSPQPDAAPAGVQQVAAPTVEPPDVTQEQPQAAAPVRTSADDEDSLVNTTFRLRRSVKHAFNAAFLSAKLHEGWPSAEAYFQDMIERETKRIEDAYNNGQPFPIRDKALPRGRPLGS